jgi:hypothetical protein
MSADSFSEERWLRELYTTLNVGEDEDATLSSNGAKFLDGGFCFDDDRANYWVCDF